MTIKLEKFLVELAIGGISNDTDPMAEQEFDFELGMRPHILGKKLSWDDRKKNLVVQVVIEDIDESFAAKQMAEEIFEVANAVLKSVDGLNVRVITSRQFKPVEEL
jgi:hypothetical protein